MRCLVIWLAATPAVAAQDDALDAIARRLDSERWEERGEAYRALDAYCEAHGFHAIATLEEHTMRGSPDVRAAFGRWRELLVLARERREDVAVFDRAGWPFIRGRPFVRVQTGKVFEMADGSRRPELVMGWLLAERPEEIRILDVEGLETRWARPGGEPLPLEYAPFDYDAFCREWTLELHAQTILEPALLGYWAIEGGRYGAALDLIGLARSVAIDAARYLPQIVERFEAGTLENPWWVLGQLAPHLGPAHEAFVVRQLDHENPGVVLAAARILWSRFGSERGLAPLVRRLEAMTTDECDRYRMYPAAIEFLAELDTDVAVDAFCRLLGHPVRDMKTAALWKAEDVPDPRVFRALLPRLADRDDLWEADDRYADFAAAAIAGLVGLEPPPDHHAPVAERDRYLDMLERWIAGHPDGLPRDELRRIAAARRGERNRR